MTLQQILFGNFVPPQSVNNTIHRIGFSTGHHYVEPPKRVYVSTRDIKDPNLLAGSKLKIYNILKNQVKPVPPSVVEKKTQYTKNHCSIIMAELFKMGMLTRKKVHGNGTRYYVYEVKK